MSENPQGNEGNQYESRKFGPHLRLEAILKQDCDIETKGMEERSQLDKWRMQRNQLMHELTWVGVSQEGSFGQDVTVAKPHDRQELTELLMDLVARNRFNPTHGLELHYDCSAVERECDIKLGEQYWSMRKPFSEYWQGRYRPDAARRALLKQVVEDEKNKQDNWPLKERAWQWVERYFNGCCPQDIEVPENQDPEAVLAILERDFKHVEGLSLSEQDRAEVLRVLKLYFLGGEYPIVVENVDEESEEAMLRTAEEIALAPSEAVSSAGMDHRAIAVSMVFQRYRNYVAQGLDFEEEEQKRIEEMRVQQAMHQQDLELRQREFQTEMLFLDTLDLPERETKDWPEALERIARLPHFKPNVEYREQVHSHVRWLVEQMPWEGEVVSNDDPWGTLTTMLQSYWTGRYYPDPLRWKILQEECLKLPEGLSHAPHGGVASTFYMHKTFIEGCKETGAKAIASQDSELVQIAYDNDMQLIQSLGLSDDIRERSESEYRRWLLEGKLPIMPDREMPDDRDELATRLQQHVEEYCSHEIDPDPVMVLQIFCDHWHPISRRPAPRKE